MVTQPRIQGYQKRMQAIAHTTSQNAANKDSADALRSMLKDGSVRFFITITIYGVSYDKHDHCQVCGFDKSNSFLMHLTCLNCQTEQCALIRKSTFMRIHLQNMKIGCP